MKKFLSIFLAVVMVFACTACEERTISSGEVIPSKPVEQVQPSTQPEQKTEPIVTTSYRESYEDMMWKGFDAAKAKNSDTVAWLYIPGCEWNPNHSVNSNIRPDQVTLANNQSKVNNAVMQYTDDEYYERRNEEKLPWTDSLGNVVNADSIWGCYYADFRNELSKSFDEVSSNTVIYGHSSYRDKPDYGPRFSQLFRYICDENGDKTKGLSFLKENPYIYLATENDYLVYQIFAVFYANINDFYFWSVPEYDYAANGEAYQKEQLQGIIDGAKIRSEYIIDLDVDSSDKLLTLSTCTGQYNGHLYNANGGDFENYRMVVMAKLLDTTDVPINCTTQMMVNPSPLKS